MISEIIVDTALVCTTCLRRLPIREFRRRKKGRDQRHHQCRECFNAYLRRRRTSHRRQRFYHDESVLLRVRSAQRLAFIVSDMFGRLGGIEEFARQWHDCIEAAKRDEKHHIVFRGLKTLLQMMLAAEQLLPNTANTDDMTTEELRDHARPFAMELIRDNPEIVLRP